MAVVEFVFDTLDTNSDSIVDEAEMLSFYQTSNFQDIISGSATLMSKTNLFFKAMGAQKKDRFVRIEQLLDYYLTKSLEIEDDISFRNLVLDEWDFSDFEVDSYITQNYAEITLPPNDYPRVRRPYFPEPGAYSMAIILIIFVDGYCIYYCRSLRYHYFLFSFFSCVIQCH